MIQPPEDDGVQDRGGTCETAFDVFVSHSSHDRKIAIALCARLEANGIRCWMAPRDILPGTDWSRSIIQAILHSRMMVLVWSAHSNISPEVEREVGNAARAGLAVLPFRIEDIKPTEALQYFIGNAHWLDALTPPVEAHLGRLVEVVQVILGGKSAGDTAGDSTRASADVIAESSPPTNRWLWGLMLAAACAAVLVLVFWTFEARRARQADLVFVQGKVLTAEGSPADGSIVELSGSGDPLTTAATQGWFAFPVHEENNTTTLTLQAAHGSARIRITATAKELSSAALVLQLPPGEPPFRVTHFLLEGYALDFLQRGMVNADWEERLAGQPFIISNSVFRRLRTLYDEFPPERGTHRTRFRLVSGDRDMLLDTTADSTRTERLRFFPLSDPRSNVTTAPVPQELLSTLSDPDQPWSAACSLNAGSALESLILRRPAQIHDLRLFSHHQTARFYAEQGKDAALQDIADIEVDLTSSSSCMMLKGRLISTTVAVLENVTSKVLQIGKFTFKEDERESIRSAADVVKALESRVAKEDDLFPVAMLRPGEKIVLPLSIPLTWASMPRNVGDSGLEALLREDHGKPCAITTKDGLSLTREYIVGLLMRPKPEPVKTDYYVGPTVKFEAIEVNRVSYRVRASDPIRLAVLSGED